MASSRTRVLNLYRTVLRHGRSWQATSVSETEIERKYIIDEARTLFRRNKNLKSSAEIERHVQEAEARISIALHYRIPYPRPVNLPQNVLPPGGRRTHLSARERTVKQSTPVYIKSYEK